MTTPIDWLSDEKTDRHYNSNLLSHLQFLTVLFEITVTVIVVKIFLGSITLLFQNVRKIVD